MKTKITLQGQELQPDAINVLRACLLERIVQDTAMMKHPSIYTPNSERYAARARTFHLLNAVDGAMYVRVENESDKFSIFINGGLLGDNDATLLGFALERFQMGGPSEVVLRATGFSAKHFMNLLKPMADAIVDLLPSQAEDDEPIPD